jgi:integrase
MGDVQKGRNPEGSGSGQLGEARAGPPHAGDTYPDWARLHLIHRRPRYAAEAVRALRHALAKHLERPAEDFDRAAVVHALDSLSRRLNDKGGRSKTAPLGTAIAGRTAAYGRACFAWAMKRGTVTSNPFAELPMPSSITKRERVLSDEEAGAIWRAAGEAPLPYGAIVRLLMLTGQRREEVAGMTWAELSEDLANWTIPATRTKNGITHVVPLSQPARELLCPHSE